MLGQAQGFGAEGRIVLEAFVGFCRVFHDVGKIPPCSVHIYKTTSVDCDVRESMPEGLVSEALRRALSVRQPAAGLVVHSDQGSQFAATNFKALMARHEAVQSMSRRGNCYDNAHAESF